MEKEMMLCALIAALMDDVSEGILENGTMVLGFDKGIYHYEASIKRELNGDKSDESDE